MLYSAEEVRWLSSRYYTNTVWLGPHHGITRPRLAHHGCWESNFTLLSTVTCCCGLPRDYSDCSVLYICLSVLCFVGGCTCNSYSVCRVCHPERTVQCNLQYFISIYIVPFVLFVQSLFSLWLQVLQACPTHHNRLVEI